MAVFARTRQAYQTVRQVRQSVEREARTVAKLGTLGLVAKAAPKASAAVDAARQTYRTSDYEEVRDVSENGTPMTQIFMEDIGRTIKLAGKDANFTEIGARCFDWYLWRLEVSTAGVRGNISIQELQTIHENVMAEMSEQIDRVLTERGYTEEERDLVTLQVISAGAQGVANWINANFEPGQRRVFIGHDVRFMSPEFAELTARVYVANGIDVYMDTESAGTATPVTSFMAYWLNTRTSVKGKFIDLVRKTVGIERFERYLADKDSEYPFVPIIMEESGGAFTGFLRPLHNRVRRWIIGSAGGSQGTSSHNPCVENGVKVADNDGGVAPDDITSGQAASVTAVLEQKTDIHIASRSEMKAKVHRVDAKQIYWENCGQYLFTKETLQPLLKAVQAGHQYMFNGLEGVGGLTMNFFKARFAEVLGVPVSELDNVMVTNPNPNPLLGRIIRPDPTLDATIDASGDLKVMADNPKVRADTLADADADRTGPVFRLPIAGKHEHLADAPEVKLARKLGLFVSIMTEEASGKEVALLRFTANQLYSMMGFARALDYIIARNKDINNYDQAIQAVVGGKVSLKNAYFITTIASTRLMAAVAKFFEAASILTAVGFKFMGRQVGEMEDKNTRLCGHDKDTTVIAAMLYCIDARLVNEGSNILEFYEKMAQNLGGLYYYDRQDIELETSAEKTAIANRALELEQASMAQTVAKFFDKTIQGEVEKNVEIDGVTLMDKVKNEEGQEVFKNFTPTGYRMRFTDGTYMEVFHGGAKGKDGPAFTMYDSAGNLIFWKLLRVSGTEDALRFYAEISENPESPRPEHLLTFYKKMGDYLQYPARDMRERAERALNKYATETEARVAAFVAEGKIGYVDRTAVEAVTIDAELLGQVFSNYGSGEAKLVAVRDLTVSGEKKKIYDFLATKGEAGRGIIALLSAGDQQWNSAVYPFVADLIAA